MTKALRCFFPAIIIILSGACALSPAGRYQKLPPAENRVASGIAGHPTPTLEEHSGPAGPARGAETPGPRPPGVPDAAQTAYIVKNVDGDTVWVEVGESGPLAPGAAYKIRILEIDTPESTNRHDCFGGDASQFAKRELPVGSKVYLLADRQDKDRYGRYLRYLWKENGDFYNEKAVREGYARAVLYPPNDLYIDRLRAAMEQAQQSKRGLWAACPATANRR